jgi:hypothetical protein
MRFKALIEGRGNQTEQNVLVLSWLKRHGYVHCKVNDKGEVDSAMSIDLTELRVSKKGNVIGRSGGKLPQFGTITGDFYAPMIDVTTLEGWCPREVRGNCNLSNNELKNLKGGPQDVHGKFDVSGCGLTSLEGAPRVVDGAFIAKNNELSSLEGITPETNGYLDISNNKLTTLKDIHKHVKNLNDNFIVLAGNDIKSHVLGLFLIEKLSGISISKKSQPWAVIVNDYLTHAHSNDITDKRDMMIDCQHELIEAGYEEHAKL